MKFFIILLLLIAMPVTAENRFSEWPSVILWAWERPEDLRLLDNRKFGVAYLAQTLRLSGQHVQFEPRLQPLLLAPHQPLIAVTRIEVDDKIQGFDTLKRQIAVLVLKSSAKPQVKAVQIDFDAKVSERGFYRELLKELRARLPESIPLSITALASFCIGDGWIKDLPVDEAVPMLFRMGKDAAVVRRFLALGREFPVALCQSSLGMATDEPVALSAVKAKRVYVFKSRGDAWDKEWLDTLWHRVSD